ncbi:RDD family protein [Microbacterium sp. 179-I 3D2 NHS]|uniref:RDD family protein n=1 Tax=Microbacterium sp. 179-I 3D2 NHS TaxID=3235178 RepID=UPI0039A1B940
MTQTAFAQIAPISRRAIGYLIDALIAAGLTIVLGGALMIVAMLAGSLEGTLTTLIVGGPIVSLLLLGWFVVYTLMQAGKGSIGMRAQGLRLVSARDDAPLGFGRALLRNIIFGLAASIVVGYFTPLFDGSGRFQGWHDKVAGALMLDARATPAAASAAAPATSSIATPGGTADAGRPAAPAIPGIPHPTAYQAAAPATPAPAFPAPAMPAPPVPPSTPARPSASAAPGDDGALIAFVPGITQDAPPPRATPSLPTDAVSELDATVVGTPAARPAAPAAPAAPVVPAASVAPVAPAAPSMPPAPPVPPAPAAEAAASPAAPVAPAGEPDDVEETRISIPGHRLVFTWDDGTRVSVSRRTIFGRNPAAEDGAVVVPVRDETLSLSKTHFEAAAEASGGWVLDRHSTNGMTLVRDGQRIACPAGQRVPVRLGDAIEIGDRIVTIGGYA